MGTAVAYSSNSEVEVLFHPELLKKFDINGPRYTSYPSADRFDNEFAEADYLGALERVAKADEPLSLYFHLPFCPNICYYCGCNKIITKDHGRSAKYIKYVAKEMAMVTAAMGAQKKIPVTQLHWGGGTPTFLSHEEMTELMFYTREHFDLLPGGEYSIEIDPRRVTEADIKLLSELGFNRISLGVQDFNLAVQEAVHRVQTVEETRAVIDWSRKYGFKSRSVDLIYGLPKQTPETFKETVDLVLGMSPDRLSVYNYAHLPHIFKPQRRISEAELPPAADKLNILSNTIERLGEAGYVFIGMDHFAKPDDELAIAQREGKLYRNFQGYSTHSDCDLVGMGITSIGRVGDAYSQNVKDLESYQQLLSQDKLPVFKGVELDADDKLRGAVITHLICNFELDFLAIETAYGIHFGDYFAKELDALKDMQTDGLLTVSTTGIQVLSAGRLLIRNICMVFDKYLAQKQQQQFSKVI